MNDERTNTLNDTERTERDTAAGKGSRGTIVDGTRAEGEEAAQDAEHQGRVKTKENCVIGRVPRSGCGRRASGAEMRQKHHRQQGCEQQASSSALRQEAMHESSKLRQVQQGGR